MSAIVNRLVLVVSHGCDITIPTRAATAAFVGLRRSETRERTTRTRILHCGIIRCDFRRMLEVIRRRRVEHCRRNANGKIRRKLTEHLAVLANNRVLARGQPVRNVRSHFAHLDDIDEMRERLKIARIMPTEIRNLATLLSDDVCHSSNPTRIEERIVPTLHCVDHIREVVHSLASVALLTSGTLHLAELGTDVTTLRGDADTPAWHLRWLRKPTDDIFGFGMIETRFGIVNRNGANGSLSKAVSDHSRSLP
jgi:hypothetical protein